MTITFKGYAIASADGFIADDHGRMPDALRFDKDWAYFQAALDGADITLLGRHTHEAAPNAKRRRRLVVSRGVRAVIQEDVRTWWVNSEDVAPESAIAAVAGATADVAVVGGTGVFSWILEECGFEEFHLTVAHRAKLGAGRPLFEGIDGLDTAIAKLEMEGLTVSQQSWFDEEAGLELLVLRRPDRDVEPADSD